MKNAVTLKGINGEVVLKIDPVLPFSDILNGIRELVMKEKNFFSKGYLSIDTQGRILTNEEISSIEEILSGIGVSFRINEGEKVFGVVNPKEDKEVVVDHTVRSGQVVRSSGNIVILGNINPDGVVEAEGDVFVFGVIKGRVKAGSRVVALGFQPQSIIVHGVELEITTPEKGRKPHVVEVDKDGKVSFGPLEEKESKPARRGRNG